MTIEYVIPTQANPVNEAVSLAENTVVDEISNDINFRKSLFDLINSVSPKKYSILTADLLKPQRAEDYSVRNTTITLVEVPNLGIFNPKKVWYNRIHTSRLGIISVFKGNASRVTDVINQINTKLNTSITKEELQDFVLPPANANGNVDIVLLFNDLSARYYSGTEVVLKSSQVTNITKQSIGLGNVDDTSDVDKPISAAQLVAASIAKDLMQIYVRQQMQLGIDSVQLSQNILPVWSRTEW